MIKQNKINYIKHWLQKFGNRDNETFNIEVEACGKSWRISMQYNFDEDGSELTPDSWCSYSFKHVFNNELNDRSEEELDEIIEKLKQIKNNY